VQQAPAQRAPKQQTPQRQSPKQAPAQSVPAQQARAVQAPARQPQPNPAPTGSSTFVELGVPTALADCLAAQGITTPFPIQAATLPDSLAGKDVLGRGRTGSGKTVAFAVPTVATLLRSGAPRRPNRPRSLILVPTRELANQVAAVVEPLAKATGLRVTTVFGGVGQGRQVTALKGGIDVLIACPGRLEDLIKQRLVQLDAVEVSVLDEADHMADLGFLPGVKRILDLTPKGTQRLLFSATLDNGIDVLVKRYLVNPVTHAVDTAASPVSTMTHHVFAVSSAGKATVVRELAGGQNRTLLFMRTKHAAKKLAKQLTQAGIPAVDLHGNLAQNARERNLQQFTDGTVKVLVATDIAARGIHVDDIGLVVHVDPPAEHKAYLHRSGRTARAGAGGTVVTVMTPDQHGDVRTLTRQAGIKPLTTSVEPGDAAITALTGPKAEFVQPAPEVERASTHSGGRSGGSRQGAARQGVARQGQSRPGAARSGAARQTDSRPSRSPQRARSRRSAF
jgi:superfamily II DNA/RNA helicase